MNSDAARYRAERDFERQRTQHHIARSRELERMLAGLIACAQHHRKCKCDTCAALRQIADELSAG